MPDGLWERAAGDLLLRVPGGPPDSLIWEHSSRVARLTEWIAGLPEVGAAGIDPQVLTAAALYHDAGWAVQVRAGDMAPRDVLLRPTSDLQRELGADWMMERLSGLIPPGPLQTAAKAVRQCNDRQSRLIEAQILAEAENLDEIGPQTVWMAVRKQLAEGRTLGDLVDIWKRQEEYHYWQARLKEGFRFEPSRTVAEQRYQGLRRFMQDLRSAVRLEDVKAGGVAGVQPDVTGVREAG